MSKLKQPVRVALATLVLAASTAVFGAEAKKPALDSALEGASWKPLERGLPQEDAYETVLRDALDVDSARPAGVYFGTRSGKVYASADDGESWTLLRDGLPPVVCVKAAVVGAA